MSDTRTKGGLKIQKIEMSDVGNLNLKEVARLAIGFDGKVEIAKADFRDSRSYAIPSFTGISIEVMQCTKKVIFVGITGSDSAPDKGCEAFFKKAASSLLDRKKGVAVPSFFSATPSEKLGRVSYWLYDNSGSILKFRFCDNAGHNPRNMRMIDEDHILLTEDRDMKVIDLAKSLKTGYMAAKTIFCGSKRIRSLGKPSVSFGMYYIPVTFEDGTSLRWDIHERKFSNGKTVFDHPVSQVIGKVADNVFAAVTGNSLTTVQI